MSTVTYYTKELILEYPANASEWPSGNRGETHRVGLDEAFDAESGDRPVWIIPNNSFKLTIGVA
jgi:hypothetical protein